MNPADSPGPTPREKARASKRAWECREWAQRRRDGLPPIAPRRPALWFTMLIDALFRRR